jgi:serine/threonine protein kinase
MAPELLQQSPHGRRIDIWSLGCTIIEMVTGIHPWYRSMKLIIKKGKM